MRFPFAIIPAGGKGSRMGPGPPKCLREVNGKPIIQRVIHFWRQWCDEIAVVVSRDMIKPLCEALLDQEGLRIYLDDGNGVCPAVLAALEEEGVPRQFVIALGDCLFRGGRQH